MSREAIAAVVGVAHRDGASRDTLAWVGLDSGLDVGRR